MFKHKFSIPLRNLSQVVLDVSSCHMIKLIKYHMTKRLGRSPRAHFQRRDSMSEPGNEFQ